MELIGEFTIGEHLLSGLINDDISGMNDIDIDELRDVEKALSDLCEGSPYVVTIIDGSENFRYPDLGDTSILQDVIAINVFAS